MSRIYSCAAANAQVKRGPRGPVRTRTGTPPGGRYHQMVLVE